MTTNRAVLARRGIARVGVGALIAATGIALNAAPASAGQTGSASWTLPGVSTWTVPAGVDTAIFDMYGAAGGSVTQFGSANATGGDGGHVRAALSVATGDTYTVIVGGGGFIYEISTCGSGGAGGYNGGGAGGTADASFADSCRNSGAGGGGASDVLNGGSPVLVAAGGGGAVTYFGAYARGGDGGDQVGADGRSPNGGWSAPTGGTQGSGGTAGHSGGNTAGALSGGVGTGGRGGAYQNVAGAGGGAGWYGGGGGGLGGSGAGGSNHVDVGLGVDVLANDRGGNPAGLGNVGHPGSVRISFGTADFPTFTGAPSDATAGSPYSYGFASTSWPAPDFAAVPSSLPPGLGLSADGTLSGTPTTPGSYAFDVTVANRAGANLQPVSMVVRPGPAAAITPSSAMTTVAGTKFAGHVTAVVTDAYGNPVPGVTMDFSLPATDPSGTFDATGSTSYSGTSGADGAVDAGTVTAGATAGQYDVTISATALGIPDATLTLTATASPPNYGLSAAFLGFADQTVGTTSDPMLVTLYSTGGSPLHVTAIDFNDPVNYSYAQVPDATGDTCTSAPLAPGDSCQVNLVFHPTAAGAARATLTFTDDAGGGGPGSASQNVEVSGTGIAAPAASITISPSSGRVSTPITVSGAGFGAGEPVTVHLNSATGRILTSTTATSSGTISVTATIPTAVYGPHDIVAVGSAIGTTARMAFTIGPNVSLSASRGSPGGSLRFTLTGFKTRQSVSLRLASRTGALLARVTTGSLGCATGNFRIPAATSPGVYTVYAVTASGPTADTRLRVS